MLSNTNTWLWKQAGTKEHFGALRLSPTGAVYSDPGELVAHFAEQAHATRCFQDAGWIVQDDNKLLDWKEARA